MASAPLGLPRLRTQSEPPARAAAATVLARRRREGGGGGDGASALQFSVSPENVAPSRRQVFLFLQHREEGATAPSGCESEKNYSFWRSFLI